VPSVDNIALTAIIKGINITLNPKLKFAQTPIALDIR
jgi:hypothetical protein